MVESKEGSIASMEMVAEQQIQPTLSPQRTKIQETLDDLQEEEDRISALPDCLVVEILSRLPSTKDAIRTGTLSKRWKSLWISVSTLIFEQGYRKSTSDFVSLVNKTLMQCRHSELKKFELYVDYDIQFESQVNDWIIYAIISNVEELTLTIWNRGSEEAEFLVDENIFINSCFTDLTLGCCVLHPNGTICWEMLRSLCISQAYLDEDLIENILSGSPVLEDLVLQDCYGYSQLNITSKSVKNLVFSGYFDLTDQYHLADVIGINAPNILSLRISSDLLLWKLLLLDVSSLVEAELDYTKLGHSETTCRKAKEEMLKGLIQGLRHVKELKVGTLCSKVLSRLEAKGFPFPSNMKFPVVTYPLSSDTDSLEEGDFSDGDSLEGGDQEVSLVDHGPNGNEVS